MRVYGGFLFVLEHSLFFKNGILIPLSQAHFFKEIEGILKSPLQPPYNPPNP